MALTLTNANRILEKLAFPALRRASHFEKRINEYGEKQTWIIDQGERNGLRAYPTLNAALAANLEQHWDGYDSTKLTEIERRNLRAIPSNVARLI